MLSDLQCSRLMSKSHRIMTEVFVCLLKLQENCYDYFNLNDYHPYGRLS